MKGQAGMLLLLLLGPSLLGCSGGDPVKGAIRRLAGTPAESRRAAMELRLTSEDPAPLLIKAILNPGRKQRVRVKCVEILADIATRRNDKDIFAFLVERLDSEDPRIRKAAIEGFVGADYEDAVPVLLRLKKELSVDHLKLIEEALKSTVQTMVRNAGKLWNSPDAALAEYERVEKMGMDRGMMGYSKANFLDMRGRYMEADRKYTELGMIRQWWIIGPFPNRQGMGFRQAYPPEKNIDLSASYPSGRDRITWYEVDRNQPQGLLNFESFFVEIDNVMGYAFIYVISDREQPAEIRAGSDDTITIFLNGDSIWAHEQYRAAVFDDDIVAATLRKGVNTLLFKVCEDWGAWQLIARITGPGDTPLKGVKLTLHPDKEQ